MGRGLSPVSSMAEIASVCGTPILTRRAGLNQREAGFTLFALSGSYSDSLSFSMLRGCDFSDNG